MFNFADATEKALAAGAAVEVADADALVATVAALLEDAPRRRAMHDAALTFHAAHRGAADRLMAWLAPRLDRGDRREGEAGASRQPLSWRFRSSMSWSDNAPTEALRRRMPIRYLK